MDNVLNITHIQIEPQVKEAIRQYVIRVRERFGDSIKRIILFGSYARGTANKHSDVDILVITSPLPYSTEYEIMSMGYDLYLEMGVLLSVKLRTEEAIEKYADYFFIQSVMNEGLAVG
jgi:hypothetical protein